MRTIKIEFPNDYVFVPGVRACIARAAYNFSFDERQSYHIETVIDEICNNAIEHGCQGQEKVVKLECKFDNDEIKLAVHDSGGGEFNIEKILRQNLTLMEIEKEAGDLTEVRRGRGLVIVQKLVDSLDVQTGQFGTTVTVVKKKK